MSARMDVLDEGDGRRVASVIESLTIANSDASGR